VHASWTSQGAALVQEQKVPAQARVGGGQWDRGSRDVEEAEGMECAQGCWARLTGGETGPEQGVLELRGKVLSTAMRYDTLGVLLLRHSLALFVVCYQHLRRFGDEGLMMMRVLLGCKAWGSFSRPACGRGDSRIQGF